ncbi:MAG: hypothetical protein AB8B74_11355 [Crocinitomicaceae bacterium]
MNKFLFTAFIGLMMIACTTNTTDAPNTMDAEELAKLKSENRALQASLSEKDSVLNESLLLFNEIEENLAKINLKEDEIRFKSKDVELAEDGKQWILQEIQNINYLREANQKKIKTLNKQLKNSSGKITELENLISGLSSKIELQDQEIELLRTELSDLDREYVELLEAYQEQSVLTAETIQELNTAYYTYGSFDELESNGVLVKEGGFIGIGKKTELNANFNEDYFTEIDVNKVSEIEVSGGKKIKLVSDHSSSSYSIETNGTKHILSISDPSKFWKVSKYLVIVTD